MSASLFITSYSLSYVRQLIENFNEDHRVRQELSVRPSDDVMVISSEGPAQVFISGSLR